MVPFEYGGKAGARVSTALLATAILLPTARAMGEDPNSAGAFGRARQESAAHNAGGSVALEIPFVYEEERGAIVLEIVADRRTAVVLLDTGAAYTVLSADFVGLPRGGVGTARFSSGKAGLSGEAVWMRVALKLGGRDLGRQPVGVMDMSAVSRVYKRRVDGLLGQDILMRFDSIEIDFRARLLRLVGAAAGNRGAGF